VLKLKLLSHLLCFCIPLTISACLSANPNPLERSDVQTFIDDMVSQHDFKRAELETVFKQVKLREDIIETMTRPAEGKPWHQYRPIFLTEKRINGGVKFWQENAALLTQAEQKYGVPAEVIVAIIGVETYYGRHAGKHRVIDALSTLAFDYPPRAKFFRGQLEHYLLMSREENFDPLAMLGSYAGAMGQPQFIPSSFRQYAVDFDKDGTRDLWTNRADVIGSVANYFSRFKWQTGGEVAYPAEVKGKRHKEMLEKGIKPKFTAGELKKYRVKTTANLKNEEPVALLKLEGSKGPEYWVTLNNFHVITRYNRSPLYAMAVYRLSEAIRSARNNGV
jgi:membrane-bound lytic murein transglycosylase B